MQIVNIVDRIDDVNFGVRNAALCTAQVLKEKYGVDSQVWYPKSNEKKSDDIFFTAKPVEIEYSSVEYYNQLVNSLNINPQDTVIVSHGCWRVPTKLAKFLADKGFKWVYTPHGMLEPWCMKHKFLKKFLYFHAVEKRLVASASVVRAVSSVEMQHLEAKFGNSKIKLIPNGTFKIENSDKKLFNKPYTFLFLGRLNFKKSVLELAKAWQKSDFAYEKDFLLKIVGPDDGELSKIQQFLKTQEQKNLNIELIGECKVGEEKVHILRNSDFFLLPSKSEGFPTSVVEAGMYGLIPVISNGCNFPELFEKKYGIKVGTSENEILEVLNLIYRGLFDSTLQNWRHQSENLKTFFKDNYSIERIAEMQYELYSNLLLIK
ncbi:MAG: glycosyltransferase [Bacteroidales bacterium]|nr:glycosyltransferase [Bacteroidales bacterium]